MVLSAAAAMLQSFRRFSLTQALLPLHLQGEIIQGLHEAQDRACELADLVVAVDERRETRTVKGTRLEAIGSRCEKANRPPDLHRQSPGGDQAQSERERDRQRDEES